MINMKNIFKSLLMVLSGAMLFASCQEEAAPLASAISVDKQELTFAGASAEAQKVKVKAEGEWFVLSSEEWVTVKPAYGNGDTDVTITVADNVDSYNELEGPRSTVVNFCYGTTGVTPVTVKQLGENGLDASRTYSLVTKQEDIVAGSYLIVFNNAGKHIAMEPLTPSKTYGYLNAVEVTPEDGVITMSNAAYAFSLEAAETGYNMIMSDNRYIFMTGGYNSFNVSASKADANPWTFTLNEDGTVNIAAVTHNNYIQYSTGHSSAGAYTSPQDGGLLPYLYKDSQAKSDEVLSVKDVTVPSFATEVKIKVTSNKKWSVRNHDSWIKSFTKSGENNGEIVVTFDAYTSTTEERTAKFQVIGQGTNTWVTLTQSKVAPNMTVAEFLAEDVVKGDYAILTGSIENIQKKDYGNFYLQDETGIVYIYGLYDVNGGKVFTPLGLKEGDIVTVYGKKDVYKENPPQLANGVYISHVSSKIRRKLAFSAESAEATLGNAFTAPSLSGETVGVVYSSSKPEVATVNAETGEVTLVAVGNTTITATGPETETHLAGTASYALTVSSKLTRALEFSAATASATLGEAFTAPTLSGETVGVVYSSSNAEVATVDAATGAVTIVAAGTTTITATAPDTETHVAGTASYALTVVEPYVPAIADGKYWIVAKGKIATPLTSGYGYLKNPASGKTNTDANAFTFTFVKSERAFTIQDASGQYYYMTGTYDSFNRQAALPTQGAYWAVEKDGDAYKITNLLMNKFIQFDNGYGSYGSYSTLKGLIPELVAVTPDAKIPYIITTPVSMNVDASETSAKFNIDTDMAWSAAVTEGTATLSSASGSTSAEITVSFAANQSTEQSNKYVVTITTEYGDQEVTISQSKVQTGSTITDELTASLFKATSTTYTEFSGVSVTSPAVYAGKSAKTATGGIQLRSNKSEDGIVTTASGGKVRKVVVTWETTTSAGRTLDIYGKNTAYASATDLYSTSSQGTKLGSVVMGTSTTLTVEGDYDYVGFRSNNGAMYIAKIEVTYE